MTHGSIIGYDINAKMCQISYYNEKTQESETVDTGIEKENNQIPLVMNYYKETWTYGRQARRMSTVRDSICVEGIWECALGNRKIEVDGQEYEGAQLLADFSSASVGDTYNILKNLARAMSIYMSNGRSVKLEGVGTFYYTSTAAGQGVDTPEEVNASQITGVRVRFLPEYTRSADHTATRALVPDSLKWEEWGGAASTPSGTPGGGSTSGSGDDGGDDGEL